MTVQTSVAEPTAEARTYSLRASAAQSGGVRKINGRTLMRDPFYGHPVYVLMHEGTVYELAGSGEAMIELDLHHLRSRATAPWTMIGRPGRDPVWARTADCDAVRAALGL